MRKVLAVVVLGMFVSACGGSSSPTAPSAPTPTPSPAKAVLTVVQNGTAQLCLSPLAAFSYRLRVPIQVKETAGLSANINFIRMDLLSSTGALIERREVGASTIIAGIGTNVVAPSSTNNWVFTMDFNSSSFASALFLFDFGDAKGNTIDVSLSGLNPLTVVTVCSA